MDSPISFHRKRPIKYPNIPPITDDIVAIAAILNALCGFANIIGIIKTSGGMGNIEDSINEIKAKK